MNYRLPFPSFRAADGIGRTIDGQGTITIWFCGFGKMNCGFEKGSDDTSFEILYWVREENWKKANYNYNYTEI